MRMDANLRISSLEKFSLRNHETFRMNHFVIAHKLRFIVNKFLMQITQCEHLEFLNFKNFKKSFILYPYLAPEIVR